MEKLPKPLQLAIFILLGWPVMDYIRKETFNFQDSILKSGTVAVLVLVAWFILHKIQSNKESKE